MQGALTLSFQAAGIEKQPDVAPRLALGLSLASPWRAEDPHWLQRSDGRMRQPLVDRDAHRVPAASREPGGVPVGPTASTNVRHSLVGADGASGALERCGVVPALSSRAGAHSEHDPGAPRPWPPRFDSKRHSPARRLQIRTRAPRWRNDLISRSWIRGPFHQVLRQRWAKSANREDPAPDIVRPFNVTRGTALAERVVWATGAAKRRGLLGREHLDRSEGMYLVPCQWIHMFGMRFPIDVAFLGRDGRVLALHHGLPPNHLSRLVLRAEGVLELAAGVLAATGTAVGDFVELRDAQESRARA